MKLYTVLCPEQIQNPKSPKSQTRTYYPLNNIGFKHKNKSQVFSSHTTKKKGPSVMPTQKRQIKIRDEDKKADNNKKKTPSKSSS